MLRRVVVETFRMPAAKEHGESFRLRRSNVSMARSALTYHILRIEQSLWLFGPAVLSTSRDEEDNGVEKVIQPDSWECTYQMCTMLWSNRSVSGLGRYAHLHDRELVA